MTRLFLSVLGLLVLPGMVAAQTSTLPSPSETYPVSSRTVLIGDAGGAGPEGTTPALDLLRRVLGEERVTTHVAFLGDNLYCCGLPDSLSPDRPRAEARLVAQLEAAKGATGRIVFIPGNHDWGKAGAYDAETLRRQERFVETYLDRGNTFLPDDALPGPHDIRLADRVRLVALDTQWFLMDGPKEGGESDDHDVRENGELLLAIDDILTRRDDDIVILAAHHPIRTQGRHGSRYPLKDHLFPLTQVWNRAWVPLPVIGSLGPLLRTAWGGQQDISNARYTAFAEAISDRMMRHTGRVIYAAGHEHGLQHTPLGPDAHVLVSGAGSRPDWVASGSPAAFTYGGQGLLVLDVMADGTTHLYAVAPGSPDTVLYHAELFPAFSAAADSVETADAPELPDSARSHIDASLDAGPLKRRLLGDHHRTAWARDVTAPVFDLGTVAGGLTPTKRGGGLQTLSIRLEDQSGYEYVLRSLNKDAAKTIPEPFRETIAREIFHDQTSAIFPYGALMVPALARPAGVYAAEPSLFYVPQDARFGPFEDLVANQLMLFEQRPDDDMSGFPNFGSSENVVSAASMYRKLTSDNDHRVDDRLFARTRLFDMLISDWDRHQDQWRWASYDDPDGKGTLYRPIPRDRDWAFNRMNGIIPSIIKSPFVLPKFQDFRPEFGFLRGLNQNGMPQDRRLTAGLSREDWIDEATRLRDAIHPVHADSALMALPTEARALMEPGFRETLQSRLDALPDVASEYYDILARLVDVVGTDKHERFEIEADRDSVRVVMLKTTRDGEIRGERYRRTFVSTETEEIRLFGLGGQDTFVYSGHGGSPIRVYAVGGPGEDRFVDEAAVDGGGFYIVDTPEGSDVHAGSATRDIRTTDVRALAYDPFGYWFEALLPTLFLAYNRDDGFFLGGGVTHTSYRYDRRPYSTFHAIKANVASATGAFNVVYEGHFSQRLGPWGLRVRADAHTPNSVRNYYGLGNETGRSTRDAAFYQAQLSSFETDLLLERPLRTGLVVRLGPILRIVDVRDTPGRFIGSPQAGVSVDTFNDTFFAGLRAGIGVDFRNVPVAPSHGFRWDADVAVRKALTSGQRGFTRLGSSMAWYMPLLGARRNVLALQTGFQHNIGPFPFYYASALGGSDSLRGWRRTRFAGRSAMHQNIEVRSRLFRFAMPFAAGSGGSMVFFDTGRVWTDGESSSRWHQGAGVGLWVNLFDLAVVQTAIAFSEEETAVSFGLGFDY